MKPCRSGNTWVAESSGEDYLWIVPDGDPPENMESLSHTCWHKFRGLKRLPGVDKLQPEVVVDGIGICRLLYCKKTVADVLTRDGDYVRVKYGDFRFLSYREAQRRVDNVTLLTRRSFDC